MCSSPRHSKKQCKKQQGKAPFLSEQHLFLADNLTWPVGMVGNQIAVIKDMWQPVLMSML